MRKIRRGLVICIIFSSLFLGLAWNVNATVHNMCLAVKGYANNNIYLNCVPYMGMIGPWQSIAYNATDRAPAIATYMGRIWVAWKGGDKKIYFNFSDTDGNFGTPGAGPGFKLTDGSTDDSPALAVFNDRLYLAIKGLNNGIYVRYVTGYYNGGTWSPWQVVPGATMNSPGLTVVDTGIGYPRLYMAVRGMNNNVYVNSMGTDDVWGYWSDYGGQIDDAPALAWHNSVLYVAVKNWVLIYVRKHYLTPYYGQLLPWEWVSGLTDVSLGIAVQSLPDNELIMSAKGAFDNKIYLTWWDPTSSSWGAWQSMLDPGLTKDSPAMAAFP